MDKIKNELKNSIEKIAAEIEKDNDILIKKSKDGIKIQTLKVNILR